jgi:S-adenosylmethionine/arginine decarboxylase-like enzyme
VTRETGPSSHHLIGTGLSPDPTRDANDGASDLRVRVTDALAKVGVTVISAHAAEFDDGGHTLVWILAESHLVIHLWHTEGFATIDLHICDYTRSNAEKAEHLKHALSEICFEAGSDSWQGLVLPQPQRS